MFSNQRKRMIYPTIGCFNPRYGFSLLWLLVRPKSWFPPSMLIKRILTTWSHLKEKTFLTCHIDMEKYVLVNNDHNKFLIKSKSRDINKNTLVRYSVKLEPRRNCYGRYHDFLGWTAYLSRCLLLLLLFFIIVATNKLQEHCIHI